MSATPTAKQILLARLAAVVAIALLASGILWYGLSGEVFQRIWQDIIDRPGGPMWFRFILQPLMAALAAWRDGTQDARRCRNPYLWTILTDAHVSVDRLREGFIAVARVILLGFGMDAIYQAIVLKTFYPGEMLIVALLLAFAPYLLLRGLFCRIARRRIAKKSTFGVVRQTHVDNDTN